MVLYVALLDIDIDKYMSQTCQRAIVARTGLSKFAYIISIFILISKDVSILSLLHWMHFNQYTLMKEWSS